MIALSSQKNYFSLHLSQIQKVFDKVRQANLRLKLEKCHFAWPEVPFLGHIVSRIGLKMDPKKVANIQGLQYPDTKKKVRSFLGMVGYYRAFIPDFAGIAQSLFATLKDGQPETFEVSQDIKIQLTFLKTYFHRVQFYNILTFHKCFIWKQMPRALELQLYLCNYEQGREY